MMFIDSDFFIDALCLAAFDNSPDTKNLLRSVLELYTNVTTKHANQVDPDLHIFYLVINDLLNTDVNLSKKSERSRIILKFKKSPLATKDPSTINRIIDILQDEEAPTNRRLQELIHKVSNWYYMSITADVVAQIMLKSRRYNKVSEEMDEEIVKFSRDAIEELGNKYENLVGSSVKVDEVIMSDPQSLARAMRSYRENGQAHVIKPGWQGMSRALGKAKGFLRGEMICFGGLSHQYKSGMLLDAFRWCCRYGDYTVQPGYKPAVLFISLENEATTNAWTLIKSAYVNIFRKPVPDGVTDDELVAEVSKFYNERGVTAIMTRFDENFSLRDFMTLHAKWEQKGYEICAALIDYLTIMKVDLTGGINPVKAIENSAQGLYNYCKRHRITLFTAVQLDTETARLKDSGAVNIVKKFSKANIADCRGIFNVVDVMFFLNIENNTEGTPYLTIMLKKHRGAESVSDYDAYFAMRFQPDEIGIPDDVDGETTEVHDIYADITISDNDAKPINVLEM